MKRRLLLVGGAALGLVLSATRAARRDREEGDLWRAATAPREQQPAAGDTTGSAAGSAAGATTRTTGTPAGA